MSIRSQVRSLGDGSVLHKLVAQCSAHKPMPAAGMRRLFSLPEEGEALAWEDWGFEVVGLDGHRVGLGNTPDILRALKPTAASQ